MEERIVHHLGELDILAKEFIAKLPRDTEHATIAGLSGDLGSGKTAFVKAVAKELGVAEEVLSPTFVLAKFYELKAQKWKKLIHIDLYRIEDEKELRVLRFEEISHERNNLVFIEWPERVPDILPPDSPLLHFRFIDVSTRGITGAT